MTAREGRTCPICGAVMEPWAEVVCDQCDDWQAVAEVAESAIADAVSNDRAPHDVAR